MATLPFVGMGQGVVGEEVKYYSEFGAFASDKKDDESLFFFFFFLMMRFLTEREHKSSTLERMRNDIFTSLYLT